jgi:hypothetical protein
MMADTQNPPPGIEEKYLTATNATNLTLDLREKHVGPLDVVIASAYAPSRLGNALIQLRAEWDRTNKPAKRTDAEIAQRAAQVLDKKGKPDLHRARAEALIWHARAMRERAMSLRGRNVVIGLLTDWAVPRGIDVDLISPTLFHWLAPRCPVCDGRKTMRRPDAPVLTEQKCNECKGTGGWPRPPGAEAIHGHIKKAVGYANSNRREKLYG